MSQCANPQLVHTELSSRGMTVNWNEESNVSDLTYIMVFDKPVDGETVLLHPQCPRLGMPNPFADYKFAISVRPEITDNPSIWNVEVSFDSQGAPAIVEGSAYDFASRSITTEKAASGLYKRYVYNVDPDTGRILEPESPTLSEDGLVPFQNTAGDDYDNPLMVEKVDILLSYWILASKVTGSQVENGSIYKFIGSTNDTDMTICGIPVKAHGATVTSLIPTIYRYFPPGSDVSELRYKLTFELKIDPNATGYGIGVLSQGRNAILPPRGSTTGDRAKRPIWTNDLNPEQFPFLVKDKDVETDYDSLLTTNGWLRDPDITGRQYYCYTGNVPNKPFQENELPLPTRLGSYAKS